MTEHNVADHDRSDQDPAATDLDSTELSVAVINYSFPVTTQTFHHRRQRAMLDQDALASIHFVKHGGGTIEESSSSIADHAEAMPRQALLAGATEFRRQPVRRALLKGLRRTKNRNAEGGRLGFIWQAWHGAAIGRTLPSSVTHIHAVFATAPATIGLFASLVSGKPLSVEVHTPASRTSNPELLLFKLGLADLVVSISDYTTDWLVTLDPNLDPVLVRCGLDITTLPDDATPSIDVLAVGSLAPKKGHDVLIDAVAQLPDTTLSIVGGGPGLDALTQRATAAGVPATFEGALSPDHVAARRRQARVGALASVRTADGDEDGIPVALMEFMLDGVPVVASDIAGIRELLAGGETGALVPPGDTEALAAALKRALTDDLWRAQVTQAARRRIETTFNNETETGRLLDHLRNQAHPRP